MARRSTFDKLRTTLPKLTLDQARQLYSELGSLIQELEQQPAPSIGAKGREIVEVQHVGDRLYQLERIRCGKAGCKCAGENGELHGPYWYAYWRDDGKLKSRYIGKQFRLLE